MLDAKGDILAGNALAAALLGDFSAWPPPHRNAEGRVEERRSATKTVEHSDLGRITLDCDVLVLPDTDQRLVVYSAASGSAAAAALDVLRMVGTQAMVSASP